MKNVSHAKGIIRFIMETALQQIKSEVLKFLAAENIKVSHTENVRVPEPQKRNTSRQPSWEDCQLEKQKVEVLFAFEYRDGIPYKIRIEQTDDVLYGRSIYIFPIVGDSDYAYGYSTIKKADEIDNVMNRVKSFITSTKQMDEAKLFLASKLKENNVSFTMNGNKLILGNNYEVGFSVNYHDKLAASVYITYQIEHSDIKETGDWDLGNNYTLAVNKMMDFIIPGSTFFRTEAIKLYPSLDDDIAAFENAFLDLLEKNAPVKVLGKIPGKLIVLQIENTVHVVNLELQLCSDGKVACYMCSPSMACLFNPRIVIGAKNNLRRLACIGVDGILGTECLKAYETEIYGKISDDVAVSAAKWWADCVRGKISYKNPTGLGLVGDILTATTRKIMLDRISAERVDLFENILAEKLKKEIAYPTGVGLTVDYSPVGLLLDCWKRSDPNSDDRNDGFNIFPFKTQMLVYKDRFDLKLSS